ncbi:MAG: GNAT family N-acetyltransferase [Opitutaceae bacterium]|nr:GNAT family N-acetyltransferase [Opitutaceae bacterium]
MTPQALFDAYVRERRQFAPPGYRLDHPEGLIRLTPLAADLDGVVMFSELSTSTIDDAIAEQIAYFRDLGRSFEWKVYAFDAPTDLARRLEQRGFVAGDREAFMVYHVSALPTVVPPHGFRIERVISEAGMRDIVAVQEAVWGRSFPWLKSALAASLAQASLFCAYVNDQPAGTGWIDFPANSSFAELHGGAVLAAHRGRGLYSALYRVRMLEAKARGFPFVSVDAAPMSCPLLLRKGFECVCETTPYRWPG